LKLKRIPLKKNLLIILTGSLFFVSCRKEQQFSPTKPEEICLAQTTDPMGRSYSCDSIASFTYTKKQCGLMPLSSKSYWIYRDSLYTDGVFTSTKLDTLRFKSYISLYDSLIWWAPDMELGLPSMINVTDSSIYTLSMRFFTPECIKDVKKEYSIAFDGESIQYLTSFDDNAAMGRTSKMTGSVHCPAGNFSDCIQFEKNAPTFRKDVVIFKPGIGVLKYRTEKAPLGAPDVLLEKISTLISYHIE
jgi:hypothetical protein